MHFVESNAEVAEAGITHLERGLGDIVFAGSKEFGGFFKACAAQPLRDGNPGLLSESAAQVKGAAAYPFAELFERGRLRQVLQEHPLRALDTFCGQPLRARTEGLAFGS